MRRLRRILAEEGLRKKASTSYLLQAYDKRGRIDKRKGHWIVDAGSEYEAKKLAVAAGLAEHTSDLSVLEWNEAFGRGPRGIKPKPLSEYGAPSPKKPRGIRRKPVYRVTQAPLGWGVQIELTSLPPEEADGIQLFAGLGEAKKKALMWVDMDTHMNKRQESAARLAIRRLTKQEIVGGNNVIEFGGS